MGNTGVSGLYRSSEGRTGDAFWGTRRRWTMLTGKVQQEETALIMLDHPRNAGFPTFWHTRGYGFFAVSPLGQGVFGNGKEKGNFAIPPGQSATSRYRLVMLNRPPTPEQAEAQFRQFA